MLHITVSWLETQLQHFSCFYVRLLQFVTVVIFPFPFVEELKRIISKMRTEMNKTTVQPLTPLLKSLTTSIYKTKAEGRLDEAVDEVLHKVSMGDKSGGLNRK